MGFTLNMKSHDIYELYEKRSFCEAELCTVVKSIICYLLSRSELQYNSNSSQEECSMVEIDFGNRLFRCRIYFGHLNK